MESTLLRSPFKLVATGSSCVETVIKKEGESAQGTSKIKFTGVKLIEPAGCTVPASFETSSIKYEAYMEGTSAYQKLEPASGTTFFKLPITECAAESTVPITGTVFGLEELRTGCSNAIHVVLSSASINSLWPEER